MINYKIYKPSLKSLTTNKPVNINNFIGAIEDFFSKDLLNEYNVNKIQFDFFILWDNTRLNGSFNTNIIFKRIIEHINPSLPFNLESPDTPLSINSTFLDILIAPDYLSTINIFLSKNNLTGNFMIINDTLNKFKVLSISSCFDNLSYQSYDLESLSKYLIANSNGSYFINKPLSFSETFLEGYLANTCRNGALWPGDCDTLLFKDDGTPIAILEF